MDKKPLIGVSILAVVLLVMGSLSNVVGYQSVKSTTVNDSPLFQTRTQRATNKQQNCITSQFLGMKKGNLLRFPMRDNRIESLIKAIEYIGKMDDKTFDLLTKSCIQKVRQDNTFSGTNNEIIQMLQLLRKQSKTIIFSFTNKNNQVGLPTYYGYTLCSWVPGCWIEIIFNLLFILPIIAILNFFTLVWCEPNLN